VIIHLGFKEKELEQIYLDLKNKVNRKKFFGVDISKRMVFLPQCLRGKNCKAKQDKFGFHCLQCGECKIADIVKTARSVKIKVFVLPGSSIIPSIVTKFKPSAVIAVACFKELVQGIELSEKYKIPTQFVNLTRAGCRNTDVALCDVLKLMTWY
jgi:hypothetical protein